MKHLRQTPAIKPATVKTTPTVEAAEATTTVEAAKATTAAEAKCDDPVGPDRKTRSDGSPG